MADTTPPVDAQLVAQLEAALAQARRQYGELREQFGTVIAMLDRTTPVS